MAHMMITRGTGGVSDTQTLQVQESSTSSSEVVIGVPPPQVETVTLRLASRREKKKVRWRADTVDNELLYKKKSNKCCIFQKDEISDSSDEEEAEAEEDGAKGKGKKKHHHHHHHEDEDHQTSAVKRPDQEPTSTGLAASDISTS
jgi:ABC-type Zn2+ transport system substrate-binding protein/surface adhesin